jgi:hypothetical protein
MMYYQLRLFSDVPLYETSSSCWMYVQVRLPENHESSQGIGGEALRVLISKRDRVNSKLHFPVAVPPRKKYLDPLDGHQDDGVVGVPGAGTGFFIQADRPTSLRPLFVCTVRLGGISESASYLFAKPTLYSICYNKFLSQNVSLE